MIDFPNLQREQDTRLVMIETLWLHRSQSTQLPKGVLTGNNSIVTHSYVTRKAVK